MMGTRELLRSKKFSLHGKRNFRFGGTRPEGVTQSGRAAVCGDSGGWHFQSALVMILEGVRVAAEEVDDEFARAGDQQPPFPRLCGTWRVPWRHFLEIRQTKALYWP